MYFYRLNQHSNLEIARNIMCFHLDSVSKFAESIFAPFFTKQKHIIHLFLFGVLFHLVTFSRRRSKNKLLK